MSVKNETSFKDWLKKYEAEKGNPFKLWAEKFKEEAKLTNNK